MKLVGLCGRKRSGKSTVGEYLREAHGYTPRGFADSLKRTARDIFDLSEAQVNGTTEDKETVDERWGMSPRKILQLFGTEVGRTIHTEVWVRKLFSDAERDGVERLCVTDVRFPDEAETIRARGGVVVKIMRPGSGGGDTHASETGVDLIQPGFTVWNEGSLEYLRRQVEILVEVIG